MPANNLNTNLIFLICTLSGHCITENVYTRAEYPDFSLNLCPFREPGSSVSIVSGYGLDDRAIEVRSPAQAKGLL
jgi:hypothetical protein